MYLPIDSDSAIADFKTVALDPRHQQIFAAWADRDRVDVFSTSDYHLIRSITVPSPSSLDISPDGSTLAVGTSSSHILFFDTATFAQTNDVVFPTSALGVTAFVYTANGNAFVRAAEGLSTGGGITAYWDHTTNTFNNQSDDLSRTGHGIYQTNGPLARSDDYTKVMLGDSTTAGGVQIIDGSTGQILQQLGYGSYIMGLAANNGATRYAICAQPAGLGNFLIILDGAFNEVFQDASGCGAMTFSPDGNTLYRDFGGASQVQAIDMTTFAMRNTATYFAGGMFATRWEAADTSGMVYGIQPNVPNGAIFLAVDTTLASTGSAPQQSDPVHIVRVIDNIGSPQGGDLIRILCTGVDTVTAGAVAVKIGGALASGVTITNPAPWPKLPNLRLVTVKTPPGTPGVFDVTLNVNQASDTAAQAFQYVQTTKTFPFATSPNFLVYDSFRQRLYASHKDQVEVIDATSQQVLTPLVPASGKLANSQFAGISLSPDGSRLYICDSGADLIHVLDLNNPGSGSSIDPTKALSALAPVAPARVFETSSGELLGADVNGTLFRIQPSTGLGQWLKDGFGTQIGGIPWSSTNKGQFVLIGVGGLITGEVGLWNANTSEYFTSQNETQGFEEASANEDGTLIAAGGSTPGIETENPEIVDFDLNTIGFISQHFDLTIQGVPTGTPSFFFHPSGALLYKAGTTPVGGSVEIDDVHRWQAAASIVFPEPFMTSYSPLVDHMLAIDDTGRYVFGVTKSGITMMILNTLPLSVGNVQPAFGSSVGGETITVRGSGFQSGTVAAFGGVQAPTTFVDANTLTAVLPTLPSGWLSVTVTNPNGISYTADALFQALAPQPMPAISGFLPAAGALSIDREPLTVTITGSGFANYDWVEINGQRILSAFVDSSHMQATVPWQFTGSTGSVPLTIVSPYTGTSNTMSLPLVNAVPVIHYTRPATLVTGNSDSQLSIYGVDFVSNSVIQWNGQPVSTQVVGGSTSAGDELLIATVPAALLANSGTATVSVLNPAPGGGTSNSISLEVSPAHPVITYPSSIDFGTNLVGVTATQVISLVNFGTANYTISSVSISGGPFSLQANTCSNIGYVLGSSTCNLTFGFSPAVGAFNATVTIVDNAPGSPHAIPISGTGTQTLVPSAMITSIDSLGQTVAATVYGKVTLGGTAVPGTAWIEYGTDRSLATFSKSSAWSLVGDSTPYGGTSGVLTGLSPATTYAARLAVQTAGGIGKSDIKLFATMPARPWVAFELAPGTSNIATISAGQTATFTLLAWDGGNGYVGSANFSCSSGLPTGATCSVNPATATIGVTGTPLTISIATTAPASATLLHKLGGLVWAFGFVTAACINISRKKLRVTMLLICVLGLTIVFPGCGGGGGSSNAGSGSGTHQIIATPSGTYFVTVSGSTGGAQNSALLTLTVR